MLIPFILFLCSAGATAMFAAVFPPWLIIPYGISVALISLCAGLFVFYIAKKRGRKKPLLRAFIGLAVFAACFAGSTFLINNVILNAVMPSHAAMAVTLMLVIAFTCLFAASLRAAKVKVFPSVLLVILTAAISFSPLARLVRRTVVTALPGEAIYPAYRAIVKCGGVGTDDKDIFYSYAYATEKIKKTDSIGKNADFSICLAKNEREGCQLSVAAAADGKTVSVRVGDFTNAVGSIIPVTLYRESYLDIRGMGDIFSDEYPDGFILSGEDDAFTLQKNKTQTWYIETLSTADTPAGTYSAPVELLCGGKVISSSQITAEVYDFALPETPACKTAIGLPGGTLFAEYGLASSSYANNTYLTFYDGAAVLDESQQKLYKQYYDFLLEHKLCANFLPYDLLDPRADEYMNDSRVTSFCIPYPKEDDEKLQEYYDKVSSNKLWRDKAYFYPVDEPFDMDRIYNFNSITDRLTRLCPGYNMIVPFGDYNVQDPETGTVYTGISLEENKVNLLCPISSYLDDIREWFNGRVTENGDIPWWYVCCGPSDETGLCNLFTYQPALKHRILFWQQKANGIAGFLYYDSINWDFVDDPWNDPQTFGNPNGENDLGEAGDGCFIYPGIGVGVEGPAGSLRLAAITDGLDDYDYLTLAEQKLGTERVAELIKEVTPSMTEYTLDSEKLYEVRQKLAEAIQ